MAKYMIQASYTQEGIKGLMKEGAASRVEHIGQLVAGLGGSLEAFYWAFGDTDVFAIADLPDNQTAAGLAMAVGAGGAVSIRTIVLLTAEDMDAGIGRSVPYRPPGA
jgi:uncharacterized protein with GYD domain